MNVQFIFIGGAEKLVKSKGLAGKLVSWIDARLGCNVKHEGNEEPQRTQSRVIFMYPL
jgi:hypothetical protein